MPNPKACKYYGIDYDTWIKDTTTTIETYSNLPIEVRVKGSRSARVKEYTIYDALDSGTYATVTMNSMAAMESIVHGVPAFVSVPCAAGPLASNDLAQLNNPFKPDIKLIEKQCKSLAYGQFTLDEIQDGTAYDLTERYS